MIRLAMASSSSSDDDCPEPPAAAECQRRIEAFMQVAKGTDEAYAQMMLQKSQWLVEAAVDKHFAREVSQHHKNDLVNEVG